ncbi:MAG: MarR family winged helix-turn-helix transcriptional regulator [Eggerthellaceae bacterium]|nr:MarR family winged helix-turn-helix transcriptional regulator [Eggerthellaceae bacterium]
MAALPDEMKQRFITVFQSFRKEKYLPLVAPAGITPAEASAIWFITISEKAGLGPIQPHFIAKGLLQTPSAVSQTLKSLEEKGYIRRERQSADSRAVSLILTKQGTQIAAELGCMYDEHFGELLEYIGEEDAQHLLRTLEKVLDFHRAQAHAGKMERIDHPCE